MFHSTCLFETWREISAPTYHLSELWPAFHEDQIVAFIKGHAAEPTPAKSLNVAAAAERQATIERFVAQAERTDQHEYACRSVYLDYEAERLAALDLILHSDDATVMAATNDRLYGSLETLGGTAAVGYLARHLDQLSPAGPAVAAARDRLLGAWDGLARSDAPAATIDAIDHYRALARPLIAQRFGFTEGLLEPYPPGHLIASSELVELLQRSLDEILGQHRGTWQAALKPGAPNIFIDNERQTIMVPEGRQYTRDHARALIVHEIGVHVQRAVSGARSHERLAGYGLPGYGPTEEAFGALLGSASGASTQPNNWLAPFAIIEFAGRTPHPSFRAVFDFAADLTLALANPDETTATAKAYRYRRAAFSRTIRVLRLGRPGLIERSTTKYWHGMQLLAQYLDQRGLTATTFDEFLLGKYDCLNPHHLQLIRHHLIQ